MTTDGVHIDPAQAAGGVSAWQQADSRLRSSVQAKLAAIEGLEAGAPWGADGAGQQFAATYPTASEQVATAIRDGGTRLQDLGANAEQAIGASLASDEEQAAPVRATEATLAAGDGSGGTPGQ